MADVGKTGLIYQNIKLYIEGVQVPFESISISQGVGTLPSASIVVPPQSGLMDIARFYQPKVHIFYEDITGSYDLTNQNILDQKDKLIFSGHIQNVSYSKSMSGTGSVSIMFNCAHKNTLITECLIDYSSWIKEDTSVGPDANAVKPGISNSKAGIIEALAGITSIGPVGEVDPTTSSDTWKTSVLPQKFKQFGSRFVGMPGVMTNFWNQLSRAAYIKNVQKYHEGFIKMYKPLIEDGLLFFNRISGHSLIELANQTNKTDYCPHPGVNNNTILVPPNNRLFIATAVQADLTISSLSSFLQASGEITNIYEIFNSFYETMDYEILTLASPAEVPLSSEAQAYLDTTKSISEVLTDTSTTTSAVETIIKPKIPFYFSPTCNVIYPEMYSGISVSYDESNIPTRVDMVNHEMPQSDAWGTHFRSPASVRSAIAAANISLNPSNPNNLFSTIASSSGAIGLYEQGRGVKIEYNAFPRWLSYLSNSQFGTAKDQDYPDAKTDPVSYQALQDLQAGWVKRYPNTKDLNMCPWAKESGISAHSRILFSAADYYYSMVYARSKAGSLYCLFNPHIVPGYPMDILEANPTLPSFHAMCVAVTHNFTASSISTQVSFTAAMTYSELANYYIPFINPTLQVILNLAKNPTLVDSTNSSDFTNAVETAHTFYQDVLGVTAAVPQQIYDFSTGKTLPVKIGADSRLTAGTSGSSLDRNGGELNPNLSYEGNLSLTYRPIESRGSVQTRFGIKFIDLKQENYNPTAITYSDSILTTAAQLEIGQSQFLTYNKKFGVPV